MHAPLPPPILRAVRVPTFHALFAACGYPAGVTPETASLETIVSALVASDMPPPLARALFTVAAFWTEAARGEIYAAADALRFPHRWPEATSPADLALCLIAAAANDARANELLGAARILRDRSFRPLSSLIYLGAPGIEPAIGAPSQYEAPLHARVSDWAKGRDLGVVLAVVATTGEGVARFTIAHEDRVMTIVLPPPAAPVTYRALRTHEVAYDARTGRLTIRTDAPEAATPLARIFGDVLFSSPRHFLDALAVDLGPLQEHGAASLAVPALAAKLTVRAIGGTWHSGKGHAITPRGRDFFKALARYKIRIEGGGLGLLTLRAARPHADDGAPTTCDAVLNPPHLVTVSEPELTPLMNDFLDRAHITNPLPRTHDFFSLQPWNGTGAEWIAAESESGFRALVAQGILVADSSNRHVTPPEHPHAGRTATAYPLGGTRYLAWSPDPTIAPFVVEERDLVVYALAFGALARAIAKALGLESPAAKLDDDGVLCCGRRALGPAIVHVFLLTRPIRPLTAVRLMETAGHGHAVAILPEGRMQVQPLRQIAMPKLAGPWEPLLGAIVRALKLEAHVETTLYAPADARVVLHRATMRVWIDGVFCAALTEAHFRLLEALIARGGAPVHTKDVAAHIGRGSETLDTTRRTIDSFIAAVGKSFKLQNRQPPRDAKKLITMPKHAHYTLNAKAFME
jgi:hypothetical protein